MKILKLGLLTGLLITSPSAYTKEVPWFAVLFGENFETVTGASSNETIVDGEFINTDFVGKEIYVRMAAGYSLAQYRQEPESDSGGQSQSASDMAAAQSSPEQIEPMTEFGPLVDSGVGYFKNGEVKSWYCAQLYVMPTVAGSDYRLRCKQNMQRD